MGQGASKDCAAADNQTDQHKTCNRNFTINMYRKRLPVGERIQQKKFMQGKMSEKKNHARKKRREKYHAQDRPHFDIKPDI